MYTHIFVFLYGYGTRNQLLSVLCFLDVKILKNCLLQTIKAFALPYVN